MSVWGGEGYFALALEWRLRAGLLALPEANHVRPGIRPIKASKDAARYVRFTSTPAVS